MARRSGRRRSSGQNAVQDIFAFAFVLVLVMLLVQQREEALASKVEGEDGLPANTARLELRKDGDQLVLSGAGVGTSLGQCQGSLAGEYEAISLAIPLDGSVQPAALTEAWGCVRRLEPSEDVAIYATWK